MPAYRRRKYNKRRPRRPSRRKVYGAAASQLYRDVRRIKDAINIEYKEVQNSIGTQPVSWDGWGGALGISIQGDGNNEHVGDSVKLQRLTFRGSIRNSTGTSSQVRLIIFKDKFNQNSTPTNFLENVGSSLAVFSPKDEDTKYSSKTLFDKTYIVSDTRPIQKIKLNIPLNFHTTYVPTTNTPTAGVLRILFISDANPAGSPPTVDYICATSFTDN